MREEWNAKVQTVLRELKIAARIKNDQQPHVAPELKVRHKESGLLYTVDSVSMRDVVLRTPEGKQMHLAAKEFEDAYEIA